MEWWQTLLIALCPSILSTIVAIVVPVTQMVNAKKERLAKYESDKKQHVSQMRLDMEFSIYKELSEKVTTLVASCLGNIFYSNFDYSQVGVIKQQKKDITIYDELVGLFNDANVAINKYAAFMPQESFDKFEQLKDLCRKHIESFWDYVVQGKLNNQSTKSVKKECDDRHDEIQSKFIELENQLRDQILKLDV